MKKKTLPIILILIGFLIVFSPILFNILNSNKQKNIINKYRQNISNDTSLLNKIEIAKEYNNSIEKDQHISVSLVSSTAMVSSMANKRRITKRSRSC